MGTARFLVYMTVFVAVWLAWNTLAPASCSSTPGAELHAAHADPVAAGVLRRAADPARAEPPGRPGPRAVRAGPRPRRARHRRHRVPDPRAGRAAHRACGRSPPATSSAPSCVPCSRRSTNARTSRPGTAALAPSVPARRTGRPRAGSPARQPAVETVICRRVGVTYPHLAVAGSDPAPLDPLVPAVARPHRKRLGDVLLAAGLLTPATARGGAARPADRHRPAPPPRPGARRPRARVREAGRRGARRPARAGDGRPGAAHRPPGGRPAAAPHRSPSAPACWCSTGPGTRCGSPAADPTNVVALDDVRLYTRASELTVVVATESQIREHIDRAWSLARTPASSASRGRDDSDRGDAQRRARRGHGEDRGRRRADRRAWSTMLLAEAVRARRQRHPHRAAARRRCGSATASTACCAR